MKKLLKTTPPSSRPITFAPATVRIRKIESGMSGSRACRSQTTKPTRRTAATATSTIVRADPQPTIGARESA
jgi:hypothetical protein